MDRRELLQAVGVLSATSVAGHSVVSAQAAPDTLRFFPGFKTFDVNTTGATIHGVVVPDLRGYGDSGKPADGEGHDNYSKRVMALDQVEVMKHFGFERFPVIGHDRGGRVALTEIRALLRA